jgi:hypothetical protein
MEVSMKRAVFFAIMMIMAPLISDSDVICLKDGLRIEVLYAWEEDDTVYFKIGNGIIGYPKEDVERVEKSKIRWGKNPGYATVLTKEEIRNLKKAIEATAAKSEYANPLTTKLIKNEDVDNPPINYKRMRTLLVPKGLTKNQLKDLLLRQELRLRQELQAKTAKYKVIFIWAYDDVNRANAGLGEWVGMISNGTGTGKLSNNPKLSIKLKGPEVPAPSSREDQIYDHLQKELWKDPNIPEELVMQKVAKHYNISVKELERIFIKVSGYRNF